MSVELLNCDCMEYMRDCADNSFDLAIVEPHYGIGSGSIQLENGMGTDNREWKSKNCGSKVQIDDYFVELKRVSRCQIIWGANYFKNMPPTPCWVIWDKMQEFSGATFDMAWTSYISPSKAFRMSRAEAYTNQNKIHPTQKPVKLYKWLLTNYSSANQRILDTHLGSGSSAIAAHYFGCDFVGMEIDKDYYTGACERFERETRQLGLF